MTTSSSQILEPIRYTPLSAELDVLVVGGGPAGIAAAVASARNEAKTLLIERYGFLGGMLTAGLVNCINGFRNQRGPHDEQAVAGIAQEFVQRIADADGAYLPGGNVPYCVVVDPEISKRIALELVMESGSDLLLHTLATNPVKEGGAVTGVITQSKSGRKAQGANVVIDCTGDGDIASGAGAPYQVGRPLDARPLPLQLMFRMDSVDMKRLASYMFRHREELDSMYDIQPLESVREAAESDRPFGASGPMLRGEGEPRRISVLVWRGKALLWASASYQLDGTNARELTRAELRSRTEIGKLVGSLRKIPGFEKSGLEQTAAQIGVRETRHIRGEYVLTEEDVLSGSQFDDSISIGANPMACIGKRPILDHDGFGIPYRCLLPEEVDGILLAGRCISATHEAHGSCRAMATCMATGQAAGTAAALCIGMGEIPRHVSVPKVQQRLAGQGAIVRRAR